MGRMYPLQRIHESTNTDTMKTVILIAAAAPAMIEVKRDRKPDGYDTRYWAVYVDGGLLEFTVYRTTQCPPTCRR